MEMEEFIKQKLDNFKVAFGENRLHEYEYEHIARVLESAWKRGNAEGMNEAYEKLVGKWGKSE
ncbi:hypothetical protein [Paenibacillus jiagnxiensis]|uniref:hypothetical protein n=1 Tax=Paenibacillus jiagnxiensis TaxID=3228926 RepID=UPI00339E24AC